MKLKRPILSPAPWRAEFREVPEWGGAFSHIVADDKDVVCIVRDPSWDNAPEGAAEREEATGKAIAALPEVMDRLERTLFFLEDQGHMPLLQKDIVSTMLKMGYTEEEES